MASPLCPSLHPQALIGCLGGIYIASQRLSRVVSAMVFRRARKLGERCEWSMSSSTATRPTLMRMRTRMREGQRGTPARSRSSSRVHVPGRLDRDRCPACRDDLDGDLARLQQWTAPGGWPLFAHARRVAAPGWCGELPGVRASAAAAVRASGKASGRRVVRGVPRGRVAPAFCCMR